MGEIAEMMLDGTLCEGCGVYLGCEDFDAPMLCEDCAKDRRKAGHTVAQFGECWMDCGPRLQAAKKNSNRQGK